MTSDSQTHQQTINRKSTKTKPTNQQTIHNHQQTTTTNQQKNNSYLQATENEANKVRIKIGEHGDDDVGVKMVVDDFGDATSKN